MFNTWPFIDEPDNSDTGLLRPGDYLFASCSQEIYGQIKAIDHDDKIASVLCYDLDLLIDVSETGHIDYSVKYPAVLVHGIPIIDVSLLDNFDCSIKPVLPDTCAYVELPRKLAASGVRVYLETPGEQNCFRCAKNFFVMRPETEVAK